MDFFNFSRPKFKQYLPVIGPFTLCEHKLELSLVNRRCHKVWHLYYIKSKVVPQCHNCGTCVAPKESHHHHHCCDVIRNWPIFSFKMATITSIKHKKVQRLVWIGSISFVNSYKDLVGASVHQKLPSPPQKSKD